MEMNILARFKTLDQYCNICEAICCSNVAGRNPFIVEGSDQVCNEVAEGLVDVGANVYKRRRIQDIQYTRGPTNDTLLAYRGFQNHAAALSEER